MTSWATLSRRERLRAQDCAVEAVAAFEDLAGGDGAASAKEVIKTAIIPRRERTIYEEDKPFARAFGVGEEAGCGGLRFT